MKGEQKSFVFDSVHSPLNNKADMKRQTFNEIFKTNFIT